MIDYSKITIHGETLESLGVSTVRIMKPRNYTINTTNINSIDDIKEILNALNINFDEWHWLNKIPNKYKTEV